MPKLREFFSIKGFLLEETAVFFPKGAGATFLALGTTALGYMEVKANTKLARQKKAENDQ